MPRRCSGASTDASAVMAAHRRLSSNINKSNLVAFKDRMRVADFNVRHFSYPRAWHDQHCHGWIWLTVWSLLPWCHICSWRWSRVSIWTDQLLPVFTYWLNYPLRWIERYVNFVHEIAFPQNVFQFCVTLVVLDFGELLKFSFATFHKINIVSNGQGFTLKTEDPDGRNHTSSISTALRIKLRVSKL